MKIKCFLSLMLFVLTACRAENIQPVITTVSPESTITSTPAAIASPTTDPLARGVWIQRSSMFTARSEMPAVALQGMIYVPGGFGPLAGGLANGKGPVTTFDIYNPVADEWKSLAPMPEPRHHEMVAAYKEKIYVFGGFVDPWITQSTTWVYDTATDQWEVLKPMPAPRTAGAAVALGDYIYLVGGTTSPQSTILPTWRYDPMNDSWQDVAPLQEPREHTTAVALDGKIYALGGRWINDLNSVEIYDPSIDQWTSGPAMQEARSGFGATVMDGKIYVAGGELITDVTQP